MELSEEIQKKAETYRNNHSKSDSDSWWFWGDYIHDAYAVGYQQALKDVVDGKTSHWCDCSECLKAKDMLPKS